MLTEQFKTELEQIGRDAAMRQAVWQAQYADLLREPSDYLTGAARMRRIRTAQNAAARFAGWAQA